MYANPCYCAYLTFVICSTCDGDIRELEKGFLIANFELSAIIVSIVMSVLVFLATGWAGSVYAIPGFIALVPIVLATYRTYQVGQIVEPEDFRRFVHAKNIHVISAILSLVGCVPLGVVAGVTGQYVFEYIERDLVGGPESVAAAVSAALPGTGLILDTGLSVFIVFGFTIVSSGVMFVCFVQSVRSVSIMTSAASEARTLGYKISDKYACSCCKVEGDDEELGEMNDPTNIYPQTYKAPEGMNRYNL